METNFHMKGSATGLALKKRPKVIRKWSIIVLIETLKTEMRNNKQTVVYFQLTCKLNNQKTIFVYNNYHFDNSVY